MLVCRSSNHKGELGEEQNSPRSALSLVTRQVKTTPGTLKPTEIRHYISDNTEGLSKINIFVFKTAVCESQDVCCWFGARPACLQCTTLSN